ncbi:hypothetical protein ADEAN_000466300 [Angomonas deanei]|uniref:Uncharacterized protein n=1 Tax=Angomonas deanei TaxID=59799 RepID=A0A7G2CCL9_9TRYP|nr:hypothetical protein ADEAN_000466300 [Angomonas deanei]
MSAAPKTLNQFRNFSYIVVAWFGLNRGFREKSENDALWIQYQQEVRNENAKVLQEREAARKAALPPAPVPELISNISSEAVDLYKELKKSIE